MSYVVRPFRHFIVPASALFLSITVFALPSAEAQAVGAASVAGIVRDTSGAVLPGVTVEASSPALIEKSRAVTTDGQGQYQLVDLRPGMYSVTFSLQGFSTVRREDVELPPNFNATINAEMRVGALEETITVSGQSPVVDVLKAEARNVISAERLESLPTGKTLPAFVALTPGLTAPATSQDVGGSKGEIFIQPSIHGGHGTEARTVLDGFETNTPYVGGSGRAFVPNPASAQAVSIELGNGSGEASSSGVQVNFVPRDGGNSFSGTLIGNFAHDKLQGTNVGDEVRSRGLTEASIGGVDRVWDVSFGLGGPIAVDRVWFYTAHRHWGSANRVPGAFYNSTPQSFFFTADPTRQALDDFDNRHHNARVTWQASKRNKVNASYDWEYRCDCHRSISSTISPEATNRRIYHPELFLLTWTFPATNRLLLEAGTGTVSLDYEAFPQDDVPYDTISVLESSTGLRYRAGSPSGNPTGGYGRKYSLAHNGRFASTYVTGSHALKAGMTLRYIDNQNENKGSATSYTFNRGVPTQISLFAYPLEFREIQKAAVGVFVQDQWTIRRLSVNAGIRYDYLNSYVPAISLDAGPYVPARSFAPVMCVPCWNDWSPRFSVAYDLFGNGKTALKASVGRYVGTDVLDLASANSPLSASNPTATRSWTDANRDLVPQESELGGLSNTAFGTVRTTTRYAEDILNGHRPYNWKLSAGVQHELLPATAVAFTYYRTTWHNFQATDNLATSAADFDPYSIIAPVDARLPGGGGYLVSGLYNINARGFSAVPNNLVTDSSQFGEQSEIYNGVDLTINARLGRNAFVAGGLSTGRTATDACFAIDSPQALRYCSVTPPFRTQIKLNGSYMLPWSLRASAVFQSLPGIPIVANYTATLEEVAPSLGRALSGGARTVTIQNLVEPQTMFEDRIQQVDVRFSRSFQVRGVRVQGMLDIYNVLNASPILAINTTYGPSWLNPTSILDARLFKVGMQLDF